MLTDYKTPYRMQHDDLSWTVRYVVFEGDYTKDRFDIDGNLLRGKDYERYRELRDVVLKFPPMPEHSLLRLLNVRLGQSRARTPIPEQRNA
jgi:hypothetical protein